MISMRSGLILVGRIFFAFIFLFAGAGKLFAYNATIAHMASEGVPFPEIAILFAILFELGGALMVMLGWHARIGALMLAIFIIVVSLFFHDFWNVPAEQMQNQVTQLLKNLALLGGAMIIMGFGAGAYSLDALRVRRLG